MKKVLIIDCGSIHIPKIVLMVSPFCDSPEVVERTRFSEALAQDFDLIIFSGSSHSPSILYEGEVYENIFSFLQHTTIPVIGICFGCELIARAYGSTLRDAGEKITGEQTICFINGHRVCLDVYEAHRFYIKEITPVFDILARGEESRSIEIIKHKTKPLLGLQFHPEVSKFSSEIFLFCLQELKIK